MKFFTLIIAGLLVVNLFYGCTKDKLEKHELPEIPELEEPQYLLYPVDTIVSPSIVEFAWMNFAEGNSHLLVSESDSFENVEQ